MSDNVIQLNEDLIKHDLKDLVVSTISISHGVYRAEVKNKHRGLPHLFRGHGVSSAL